MAGTHLVTTDEADLRSAPGAPRRSTSWHTGSADPYREPHWHPRWCQDPLDRLDGGEELDVGPSRVLCERGWDRA